MGYNCAGYLVKQAAEFSRLEGLPESLGFRVFAHPNGAVWLIETFGADEAPADSFTPGRRQSTVPGDLPLPEPTLAWIRDRVRDGWPLPLAGYANTGSKISELLGVDVLAFAADDDELDQASVSTGGKVRRFRFPTGLSSDLDVVCEDGRTTIRRFECEEDPDYATPADALSSIASDPAVEVIEQRGEYPTDLHWLAIEEVTRFVGTPIEIAWLGGPDEPTIGTLIASARAKSKVKPNARPGAATARGRKPWWQFWK